MVSLILHLPLPFPIVKALGTDLGSLNIALASAHNSCTCVPVEVKGWSGLTSVGGSACSAPSSSVSFSTCK